jgi:hypothetical protein
MLRDKGGLFRQALEDDFYRASSASGMTHPSISANIGSS